jgi:two-component system response regulator AtoC
VLATWLHRKSARAAKPMVSLNCGGLPESLIESELFGHEKGAFTGAVAAQVGLLESAHGGTLFLDEVAEMSLKVQAALLRVLETREVMPVGGRKARSIDVRLVAATNRDLEADCASGKFRQDLYFRLCGMSLSIPPLRQRVSEIPELARLLLAEAGGKDLRISAEAMTLLEGYRWPGNIRELKNVIERALVLCDGREILAQHLPVERLKAARAAPDLAMGGRPIGPPPRPLTEWQEIERQKMIEALNATNWNQSRAAKQLGIPRRTFVARLDQYGLPRPQKGSSE